MKIDIVVPNYNGADLVERNLPTLVKNVSKYDVGEIIITDDGSREEEYRKLEELVALSQKSTKLRIRLLRSVKNLGFSSNVDKGVGVAKSELVALINTDVVVLKDFLDAAISDFEKDDNLFGVGMMDRSIEEDKVVLRGRGIGKWSRGLVVHKKGEVDRTDTFWISGGSSVIRRKMFEELSGFDPLYNPFYWEDIDLSYRARKSGYTVSFEPKSIVEHHHIKGAIKKHFTSAQVKRFAYRNQLTFIWKNITDTDLMASHFLWLPYHFIRALITFDTAFLIGFTNAIFRLPAIIRQRSVQKKLYKKKDRELLS